MYRKVIAALCAALTLSGCAAAPDQPFLETIEYSNLADAQSREQLALIMSGSGISAGRQQVLLDHVMQFNAAVSPEYLTGGFESAGLLETGYDPYAMQAEWDAAHPDFMGYNCRITAFSLFAEHLEIPAGAEVRADMLTMDAAALESDGSAMLEEGDLERFMALYSTIPAENTDDVHAHVERLQSDWRERGIVFDGAASPRLISVVFHDAWEDESSLFIGHTGVLFEAAEDELYFVEKIAFQEPYRMIRFSDRAGLNDYLMAKYDVSFDQPTAPPFIMENDELLTGYRRAPGME